jgi:hypothetical protein
VAEEIEWVGGGLAGLSGDGLEINAAVAPWNKPDRRPSSLRWLGYSRGRGQLLDDGGTFGGVGPAGAGVFQAWVWFKS